MKAILALCFCSLLAGQPSIASADDPAASSKSATWQNVDGDWAGGSTAIVWKMAAWPGKDMVVASTSSNGLWATTDGGATWKRMGEPGKTPPNKGEACTFVFDPHNKGAMWTAGMYGYGVWRTIDGGKTFAQLGKKDHVDGISVDFSDTQRRTILIGLHEQEHSVNRSADGGATWELIGDKFAGAAFSTDPLVLSSKTYIVNSAGYKKDEPWGIYRTEDAGQTWTQVSKEGASGCYTITAKGRIFWSCLWDKHIITSADQGKTWERVDGDVHGTVLEVAPGRLIALGGKDSAQLYVSKDDAMTWTPFGPPVPFDKSHGLIYDSVRNSIFVWRDQGQGARAAGQMVRWDLPKKLDAAFGVQP